MSCCQVPTAGRNGLYLSVSTGPKERDYFSLLAWRKGNVFSVFCLSVQRVFTIIQFLKVMYLILTFQVPLTLPSVFSKTD